jgi:hypothetical protein
MTTLLFRDGGYDVLTSGWSAAAKGEGKVVVCYTWSSTGGTGFLSSATGVSKKVFAMRFDEFQQRVGGREHIIDLRNVS